MKRGSLRCHLPLITKSMQKTKILLDSFQRYWWSKNPAIRLDKRHDWHTKPKEVVQYDTFIWQLSPCKKSSSLLEFSADTDDQRILRSDWTGGTTLTSNLQHHSYESLTSCKIWEKSKELFLKKTINWPTDILTYWQRKFHRTLSA